MAVLSSFDVAGRRRSPATTAEFHGRTPGNKGMNYPADPPRVEDIVAVMRQAGGGLHGDRVRALIVVLWRAGLRIVEMSYSGATAGSPWLSAYHMFAKRNRRPANVPPTTP